MKHLKHVCAFAMAVVMLVTLLPATLTSAALYEGLMEQEDGRLAYVKENPSVPMGSVAVQSINSAGKISDYSSTYIVEEGNVIVMDALDKNMNQTRDWIGNIESSYKFIITDNLLGGQAANYAEDETPIEPLVSTDETIDHTATLAEDAKEIVPGVYTYRENARGTVWTITLGDLVEPSEGDLYTIVTTKNAIVEYAGDESGAFVAGKYLVVDGYVDTEANGLFEDPEASGKTKPKYYFINGMLHSEGIEIYEGYYLSYGKLNETFTGFVDYDGEKYYVIEGVVTDEDGAYENPAEPGTYYYVAGGKVDTSFNGTVDDREFVNGKSEGEAEEGHIVITCSDRHDNTDTLQNILRAMPEEAAPEAIIHNGDAVNSGAFAFADITAEFTEVFPDAKVFYSYGSHDSGAEEYEDIEREEVKYETDDYIIYQVSMNTMQNVELAEAGAAAFLEEAANFDKSKVLFVASHMPLHTRRNDNVGAAVWFDAINQVASEMTTIVLWSHNHTGEDNTDCQNYLRMPGESMTPQGGSKQKANFIYANAGYIIVGYMTQWTITDNTIKIQRYNEEGAVSFHDGITYPVVYNRNTGSIVAGDINHDQAGDGESTGGSGGGGGGGTASYYTTSEAEAAKKQPNAGAGDYVFVEDKGDMIFTWTITLNEDNTYHINEVRGSFGTSEFDGEGWSAEGNFITLGANTTGTRKGGWCDPAGFYMIVDPSTDPMSFLPSLTPEGNPDPVAEDHVIITCSDRHDNTDKLQNILKAMPEEPAPEAIIHNGDAVNSGEFAFADLATEFTEIFPDAKVFFSYGSHDSGATDLADVEPSGVMYETDDYILYDISMNQMQTVASAEEGAAAFTAAAANFDTSKVLFVASHMPLHTRRGDNLGAATWFAAINEVAANMDTIVLWSHNHTGENNTDTQNYLRMPGELMTPQGGSEQAANFIYANAGYIIVGYMTQWTINDSTITIQRYNADGAVTVHDGITYPVVYDRDTRSMVEGIINHDEAGDGESTGGGGGGGGGTPSYYTTSEAEAAKLQPEAGAGDYVFLDDKGTMVFTWTITLNEDNTYDIEEIRGSFGTSYFHGESWSAEGAFITLGPNDTGSRKGGWCDPAGFYMIVDPSTDPMSFLPSLTAEGNPDEEIQTGWVQEDGKWFYYNEDGSKATGWLKDGDTWYFLNEDGEMATGWVKVGSTWYFMKDSGAMATGWVQVGSSWYYMKDSGAMATGWLKVGSTWYYMKDSGAMATGWLKLGNTWYYLKDSGAMATGWLQLGNTWYYFQSGGNMVTGTVAINGRNYVFASSGAWLR